MARKKKGVIREFDDLNFPIEAMWGAKPAAVAVYLAIRLYCDQNGVCMKPIWICACVGLNRDLTEKAMRVLVRRKVISTFEYKNEFGGVSTGVRISGWKCPIRHERIPGWEWKRTRLKVFERDGFICAYCHQQFAADLLEVDHVEPISAGGTNELGNLVTACTGCNRKKWANVIQFHKRSG